MANPSILSLEQAYLQARQLAHVTAPAKELIGDFDQDSAPFLTAQLRAILGKQQRGIQRELSIKLALIQYEVLEAVSQLTSNYEERYSSAMPITAAIRVNGDGISLVLKHPSTNALEFDLGTEMPLVVAQDALQGHLWANATVKSGVASRYVEQISQSLNHLARTLNGICAIEFEDWLIAEAGNIELQTTNQRACRLLAARLQQIQKAHASFPSAPLAQMLNTQAAINNTAEHYQ